MFGRSIEEVQKAVVSLVGAVILLAAFFIAFEPGTEAAITAVIVYGFGVARVLLAKNHTQDDLQKAVEQLATGVVGLVGLYVTVDPSTLELILAIIGNVAVVYGVYLIPNRVPAISETRAYGREEDSVAHLEEHQHPPVS